MIFLTCVVLTIPPVEEGESVPFESLDLFPAIPGFNRNIFDQRRQELPEVTQQGLAGHPPQLVLEGVVGV